MLDKYIAATRALRTLQAIARELVEAHRYEGDGYATGALSTVLNRAVADVERLLPRELDPALFQDVTDEVIKGDFQAYLNLADNVIPRLEDAVDDFFGSQPIGDISLAILDLLHPRVTTSSYTHFRSGRYRDAVLNAFVAVFDFIRERTSIDKDGAELVAEAFSLQNPKLIFSTLETESGRNEQKGFIQVLQGAYLGVRNPKAHSLQIETDQHSAAQYLVFASLLCRKVEVCSEVSRR